MQFSSFGLACKKNSFLRLWVFCSMFFSAVQLQSTEDGNLSSCELESMVNQLINPSPEYQLHAFALRNQLKNLLKSSQTPSTNYLNSDDYDFTEDEKRSIASLASVGQGYLIRPLTYGSKRSLATLAKNGQLPTPEPEEAVQSNTEWEQKRNLGSVARSGGMRYSGKRNIGTLARDFQLPSTGKRNLATLARLGLLTPGNIASNPKRNLAALARYNSGFRGEKRNIGALKGSPVHGNHQKKNSIDQEALAEIIQRDILDYAEQTNGLYPTNDDYTDMEKRFLAVKSNQMESIDTGDDEKIDKTSSAEASSGIRTLPISESKRHIGALARSGWLPAGLRSIRSGRFSRSGRARQIVEFYPQPERLRQPTAAVCRRCYLPYKPVVSWGSRGVQTTTWGTPPRITAQYRRSFRQPMKYVF